MVNDEHELNENVPGIDEDAVLLQSCDITAGGGRDRDGCPSEVDGRDDCPTELEGGGRDNCPTERDGRHSSASDGWRDSVRGRFAQFSTSDIAICCASDVRL